MKYGKVLNTRNASSIFEADDALADTEIISSQMKTKYCCISVGKHGNTKRKKMTDSPHIGISFPSKLQWCNHNGYA